jgi:pyruvate-ferredoxin/flavodoxin oxidoreductase
LQADADFVEKVIEPVMADQGNRVPVSAVPANGAIPTGSSVLEKRSIAIRLPEWVPELCIQCNRCSFVCPHATIRPKLIRKSDLDKLPDDEKELFEVLPAKGYKGEGELFFRIQNYPEDCTGCGACATVCPGEERNKETKEKTGKKALMMKSAEKLQDEMRKTRRTFEKLPDTPSDLLDVSRMKDAQFLKPLFEFSGACAGCGETPYVKLLTQLYGDRLYIANATGCSSIYGGTMPVVPYTKNEKGQGPAWQSSLFEDNAEFGFGIAYAARKLHELAVAALHGLAGKVKDGTLSKVLKEAAAEQKKNEYVSYETAHRLKGALVEAAKKDGDSQALANLESLVSHLMKKITFAMGGDGWAYDIGYGGLDHVLASGIDMNVLVLDTGVYSNTGGQKSKATPMGAVAKFAADGKRVPKKDLGLMAMGYKTAYVAQVSYGANPAQTQKAFQEAVSFPGTSLIIAYSPCMEHGYALDRGPIHCKLAVDCGLWPIYRYDPRRSDGGENPLQLDAKEVKASYKDFAKMENRFRRLMLTKPEEAEALAEKAEKVIKENFEFYKKLAEM